MSDNKENREDNNYELLDIFNGEEDKKGTDLLAMSDFFSVYIDKIASQMEAESKWEQSFDLNGLEGKVAIAIKEGIDISNAGTLVADSSHFSKDILDGLESGKYHVGQTKQADGYSKPGILDEMNHKIKNFTLKKAINPTEVLNDISTLSMQTALQNISLQIGDINQSIDNIIDFNRRQSLSNNFIYARDKILQASSSTVEELENYLKEADTYLMEGLINLYTDMNDQIKKLTNKRIPLKGNNGLDAILTYINEDMQMIPRYVALRVYLFNYRGKENDAIRILDDYKYHLEMWSTQPVEDGKYTAIQLIHMYYPYNSQNKDFWLKELPVMAESIDSYCHLIEQKDKDVYYIEGDE